MMYRVRLYNYDWTSCGQVGDAYNTNVLPTPAMLIRHGGGLWEVVAVMHIVASPRSAVGRGVEPELIQATVRPGREMNP